MTNVGTGDPGGRKFGRLSNALYVSDIDKCLLSLMFNRYRGICWRIFSMFLFAETILFPKTEWIPKEQDYRPFRVQRFLDENCVRASKEAMGNEQVSAPARFLVYFKYPKKHFM